MTGDTASAAMHRIAAARCSILNVYLKSEAQQSGAGMTRPTLYHAKAVDVIGSDAASSIWQDQRPRRRFSGSQCTHPHGAPVSTSAMQKHRSDRATASASERALKLGHTMACQIADMPQGMRPRAGSTQIDAAVVCSAIPRDSTACASNLLVFGYLPLLSPESDVSHMCRCVLILLGSPQRASNL